MMLMRLICFIKNVCCGYSFELPRLQVEAIQMSTRTIWFYKEVEKGKLAVI